METLVVALSNSPNLNFDGVWGSILNEEIKRKSSGEGSGSAYNIRGRYDNRNPNIGQRNRSKGREKGKKQDITCYQCGSKGHKKPDCRYFIQGRRKTKVISFMQQRANMASNEIIIGDLSGEDGDVLCIIGDAFIAHVQDMQITKTNVSFFVNIIYYYAKKNHLINEIRLFMWDLI